MMREWDQLSINYSNLLTEGLVGDQAITRRVGGEKNRSISRTYYGPTRTWGVNEGGFKQGMAGWVPLWDEGGLTVVVEEA